VSGRSVYARLGVALVALSSGGYCGAQTSDEAWWTGSLLSASPAPLRPGLMNVEPTLLESTAAGPGRSTVITPILYGISDRFTFGALPVLGRSGTRPEMGDLTLQALYCLEKYDPDSGAPTLSLIFRETFPTGPFDRLGDHPERGFGGGAYKTRAGIYGQTYFTLSTGRLLRARLDLLATYSEKADITGSSVYGTGEGFHGRAKPGNAVDADLSFEYSVTREWVLVMEIDYGVNATTRIVGYQGATSVAQELGSNRPISFAPAVEYSFSASVGVILGVDIVPAGRNIAASQAPAAALNLVF
jgi:hypothetical protein